MIQKTFSRAHQDGVMIAFGTDSGVSPHGGNGKEFELMVDAGMSEMDAILSATLNTSKLLKISDQVGTITAGKFADMVAVNGNPLDDIKLLQNIDFVMKDGVVYKGSL